MKRGIVYAGMAGAVWGLVFLVPKLLPEFSPLLLSCGRFIVYGAASVGHWATTTPATPRHTQ